MPNSFSSPLLSPIFASGAVAEIFSDRGILQAMLDFEAALAWAEAETRVIPKEVAGPIAAACDAALYDIPAIGAAAVSAGNVVIPLVKALTAKAADAARDFVHYGATSQDVIDTAFMLCARQALPVMRADMSGALKALAVLIDSHRGTIMAGRTLMQQALPITFGYKAAIWLSGLTHAAIRLRRAESESLALQFGGAVGTLAALGDRGIAVRKALAARLELKEAPVTWHAERGRVSDIAAALAGVSAAATKIATDVILLTQTEVGEVFESSADGKGGSSTMPHKRNPVSSVSIRANHLRIAGAASVILAGAAPEGERGAGSWQAEWESLRELFVLSAGSLSMLREMVEGLEVNPIRMRRNLDASKGLPVAESLTFALATKVGRDRARQLVETAIKQTASHHTSLGEAARAEHAITSNMTGEEIEQALDPENYLGSADQMIDAALAEAGHVMEE